MDVMAILNEKLDADLSLITHESLNYTFTGYSLLYRDQIFVKAFPKENKLLVEKAVNMELNDRILNSFKLFGSSKLFVLVMTDINPRDIRESLSPKMAYEMGNVLANFHKEVKPFTGITESRNRFVGIKKDIFGLKNATLKSELLELYNYFVADKDTIEQDVINNSKIVLHGDVGVRNFKVINGRIALIDYEKARLGPAYQDFIKLFYQDFKLDKALISAFLRGYKYADYKLKVNSLTQTFLIFQTAVGVMTYTDKIKDEKFKEVGYKMLRDVKRSFKKGKNNLSS